MYLETHWIPRSTSSRVAQDSLRAACGNRRLSDAKCVNSMREAIIGFGERGHNSKECANCGYGTIVVCGLWLWNNSERVGRRY